LYGGESDTSKPAAKKLDEHTEREPFREQIKTSRVREPLASFVVDTQENTGHDCMINDPTMEFWTSCASKNLHARRVNMIPRYTRSWKTFVRDEEKLVAGSSWCSIVKRRRADWIGCFQRPREVCELSRAWPWVDPALSRG
jgi:hypothetical protein